MIHISNITQHQLTLLTKMWSIHEQDEFHEWHDTLDANDQKEVDLLQELMLIEIREDIKDVSQAKAVLQKIMYS